MIIQKIIRFIEDCFINITFAEANCHEMVDYNTQTAEESDETLDTFLKTVGLQNAKVSYGFVRV